MFPDASLDFLLAASALLLTNQLDRAVAEAHRGLKSGGLLLAVDEPGVPLIITPWTEQLGPEHLGERDRAMGIIENAYPERVWGERFREAGFHVRFKPFFPLRDSWKRELVRYTPLVLLNGLLFWFKVIVAHKPSQGRPQVEPSGMRWNFLPGESSTCETPTG
jgi:hypothetical protein